MRDIVIFTQNTMSSIVATREVLRKNHHKIKTIVIASELKGESIKDRLKLAYKLTKKSSLSFLSYKIIGSKLYTCLLIGHKIIKSKAYKEGKSKSIEDLALEYNIPFIKTNNLNDIKFLNKIQSLNPKYILCLVAQILKKDVFETLGNKLVNAHGSYLPEYRGAAQYVFYLVNNDEQFGVTIHFMQPGLDTGDIIFQKRFDYDKSKSMYRLHYDMACAFGKMLNEFVEDYTHLEVIPSFKQDEEKSTFTRMPLKEDIINLKRNGYNLITLNDFFESI